MKTPFLVRHPAPYPTESLLGYLLRLSEKNGYVSPSGVCRLAGIKQNYVGAIGPKVDKLAAIASCGVTDLRQLTFIRSVNGRRSYQLLGHRLAPREVNLSLPKLCPQCVAERGYIEAHWHLELMVACPIHQCVAISECPQCGEGLSWFRPGLLECNCGGNLLDSHMLPISPAEAALLDIIKTKLLRYPAAEDNRLSLPEDQLRIMDLRSILAVVRALAKHRLIADKYTADPGDRQILLAASRVLVDWPKNLIILLKDIGQQACAREHFGVGQQYGEIYRALFRNNAIRPPEHADFLRVAFLDFAMETRGSASVDDDSIIWLGSEIQPFLTDAEYAARAEKLQKTARRLLKTLQPSSKPLANGPTTANFADTERTERCRRRHDPGMILDMVRHGSNLGRVKLVDLQIADGAGRAFYREYIPLTAIAPPEQISTVELMRLCAEHNVKVLLLRIAKQGLQPIIHAIDLRKLIACLTERLNDFRSH